MSNIHHLTLHLNSLLEKPEPELIEGHKYNIEYDGDYYEQMEYIDNGIERYFTDSDFKLYLSNNAIKVLADITESEEENE